MIAEASDVIARGEIVGLPTDTVYGLAVDPWTEGAMARLIRLKGRSSDKPVGLLVASLDQADEIGIIGEHARRLATGHWPGALTLVVKPRVALPTWIGDSQTLTVALRVPAHDVALALLSLSGPLAVTSANRSGEREALTDVEAYEIFGDEVPVYLVGESTGGVASTVVDATGPTLRVLRQGPVTV